MADVTDPAKRTSDQAPAGREIARHHRCDQEEERCPERNKDGKTGHVRDEHRSESQCLPFFKRPPDGYEEKDGGQDDEQLPERWIGENFAGDRAKEVEDHFLGVDADCGPEPRQETEADSELPDIGPAALCHGRGYSGPGSRDKCRIF